MFAQCREVEMNVEQRDELAQQVGPEYGWGPAAPVQMHDPATTRVPGEQLDFPDEPAGVGLDRFCPPRRPGMAAAVQAHLPAERNVDVERHRIRPGQLAEPCGIRSGSDRRNEVWCGRI